MASVAENHLYVVSPWEAKLNTLDSGYRHYDIDRSKNLGIILLPVEKKGANDKQLRITINHGEKITRESELSARMPTTHCRKLW